MNLEKYHGVIPAFYACYDENNEISPERTRALARHLVNKGVKGLYVGGSSGECIYLEKEERMLTLENVIIYPHIGGNTVEAAHRASYFAAQGVMEVYEGKTPTWPIHDIDYETAKTYDDVKVPDKKPAGMFDIG